MQTELQKKLLLIAPSLAIQTVWSHDDFCRNIHDDCDGMENEKAEDWQAWMSEVRVSFIHKGEVKSFSDYLGGTWERVENDTWKTNPDISGYEPQMTVEALSQALSYCSDNGLVSLVEEIESSIQSIK